MSYALEKLGTIYYELAIGEGDIRERLCKVEVELLLVTMHDQPDHLKKEWKKIIDQLTERGPLKDHLGQNSLGGVKNTLRFMRKKRAARLAKEIIDMYYKVEAVYQDEMARGRVT